MFSNLSESSISFATVTPSLVIRGAPKLLSRTTLRPFGPKVTLTALVRMSIPRSIRSRASVPSRTSLAAMIVSLSTLGASGSATVDDPHDVGFLHDHHFLAVDLDFGPRPLAEEDTIAGLDIKRMNLAVFAADARSDRDDIAFHGFFLGGVGDEDP